MSTPITDGKKLVNATYHSAVISALAAGYIRLGKMVIKSATPKLDFTAYDMGMVILDVGLGTGTRDMLVKQGIIPDNILK